MVEINDVVDGLDRVSSSIWGSDKKQTKYPAMKAGSTVVLEDMEQLRTYMDQGYEGCIKHEDGQTVFVITKAPEKLK